MTDPDYVNRAKMAYLQASTGEKRDYRCRPNLECFFSCLRNGGDRLLTEMRLPQMGSLTGGLLVREDYEAENRWRWSGDGVCLCLHEWKEKNGGDEGDRTPNLRIANAALSQLSYIPTFTQLSERSYVYTPAENPLSRTCSETLGAQNLHNCFSVL